MQLGCTKKLLDAAKVQAAAHATADPFFTWSASISTVGRRKMVTVMNDASFCGFALYGVKAKDLKNLQPLVFEGIQALLESLQFHPDLIARYMQDCGSSVEMTATRNRSIVTRLNHFTTHASHFADEFSPEAPLQRHLLRRISDNAVIMEGKCYLTLELLEDAFVQHYHPEKLHKFQMIDLTVELELEPPRTCTRRVLLPQNASLKTLHEAIQALFAWEDYHMHEFRAEDGMPLDVAFPQYAHLAEEDDFGEADCWPIEQIVTLKEAFTDYTGLCYTYDFGDDWELTVHLNGFLDDAETGTAHCISATGDAPPEDVGGSGGYEDFLAVLRDPANDHYEATRHWADDTGWKPLDMKEIELRLQWLH